MWCVARVTCLVTIIINKFIGNSTELDSHTYCMYNILK